MLNQSGFNVLIGVVIICLILVAGIGGFLLGKAPRQTDNVTNNPTANQVQTPTQYFPLPSPTPLPSVEPVENWKTFEDTKFGYSIKYPNILNTIESGGKNSSGLALKLLQAEVSDPYYHGIIVSYKVLEEVNDSADEYGEKLRVAEKRLSKLTDDEISPLIEREFGFKKYYEYTSDYTKHSPNLGKIVKFYSGLKNNNILEITGIYKNDLGIKYNDQSLVDQIIYRTKITQ